MSSCLKVLSNALKFNDPTAHNRPSYSNLTNPSSLPWLDSGATNPFYRKSDIPSPTTISHKPLSVLLPNNAIISSVSTASTSLGNHSYNVNVFNDNDLHHSLEAVATFTNDMHGSVLFNEQGATIYGADNKIINFTPKVLTDRVWTLDRHALSSASPLLPHPAHAAAVVRHDLHADFVAYAHASFMSPPNHTFSHALKAGWLDSYPRLTYDMFQQNKPLSVACAKGHLDLNRKNQHSTRSISPDTTKTALSEDPNNEDTTDDDLLTFNADNVVSMIVPLKDADINYSDLPGRYPIESYLGNNYILLSYYRGAIHTEPLPDRSGPSLIKAYTNTFAYYHQHHHVPKFQRLDNETSKSLEVFLRTVAHVTIQYVPPNNKRTNKAERMIRAWKNHFISALHTVDPRFPSQLWDELLPQADDTYNMLHPWAPSPHLSAYEGFHNKKYDFASHPIAPVGTHVVIHETPDQRQSWAAHGLDGFYLGPALDHYRCYRVFANSTKSNRVSDTLAWFPALVHMPGSSPADLIHSALLDLTHALKLYRQLPAIGHSGTPLALDETISAGLRDATNLFNDVRVPPHTIPTIPHCEPPPCIISEGGKPPNSTSVYPCLTQTHQDVEVHHPPFLSFINVRTSYSS